MVRPVILSISENAMLTKNAFEYGLSKSEYLRKLILAESLTGKQWHMDRD